MAKEKIKTLDEREIEVEIHRIGGRAAIQIAKNHIPIDSLTMNKQTDDITINGNVDLFGMQDSALATIKDPVFRKEDDADNLSGEERTRIYKKYFEKDVMAGLGQGGNPN